MSINMRSACSALTRTAGPPHPSRSVGLPQPPRPLRPQLVTAAAAAMPSGSGKGGEASDQQPASSAVPPAARHFSEQLEHMDSLWLSTESKYRDLEIAESELGAYCAALSPDEETEKCWQAYSFLESKREAATDSCDVEHPETCTELDHLNDMAHQLLTTGRIDDVVATFSTLARVEEHRAARAAKAAAAEASPADAAEAARADALHALFRGMDRDGDGRITMAEFRQSMAMLGDELDGATVALIGDAMDINDGFITEQQFRDIVEAEALNSKSQVAQLWRHHHLHPGHRF